ncbi:MAG: hypothetical protein H6679_05570 [Epsilonproteobacteria bacterium]|nr:hypothetical protein [Campylobacterota bacterium]
MDMLNAVKMRIVYLSYLVSGVQPPTAAEPELESDLKALAFLREKAEKNRMKKTGSETLYHDLTPDEAIDVLYHALTLSDKYDVSFGDEFRDLLMSALVVYWNPKSKNSIEKGDVLNDLQKPTASEKCREIADIWSELRHPGKEKADPDPDHENNYRHKILFKIISQIRFDFFDKGKESNYKSRSEDTEGQKISEDMKIDEIRELINRYLDRMEGIADAAQKLVVQKEYEGSFADLLEQDFPMMEKGKKARNQKAKLSQTESIDEAFTWLEDFLGRKCNAYQKKALLRMLQANQKFADQKGDDIKEGGTQGHITQISTVDDAKKFFSSEDNFKDSYIKQEKKTGKFGLFYNAVKKLYLEPSAGNKNEGRLKTVVTELIERNGGVDANQKTVVTNYIAITYLKKHKENWDAGKA